jgi:hypothetical protein
MVAVLLGTLLAACASPSGDDVVLGGAAEDGTSRPSATADRSPRPAAAAAPSPAAASTLDERSTLSDLDLPECVAGEPAPRRSQATEPVNPADHGGPEGIIDPDEPIVNVGYYDEQLTSVDEFVSLPDAVVLGCVSEERRGEPYEVSGLIETPRLLTVEVHSVIAGELSEDATLTLVAPGWAEIYEVEREVWEGGAIRPELGDWLVLALDEETDDTCRMFSDQGAIRLSDDGPEFPPSAGLLVADLGDDADSEELLAELREAAKR